MSYMFYNGYNWDFEENKVDSFKNLKDDPPRCRCDAWDLLHGEGCKCEYKAWLEKKKKEKQNKEVDETRKRKDDCISRIYRYGD